MGLNSLPSKLTQKWTCFIEETSTHKRLVTVHHQTRHHHGLEENGNTLDSDGGRRFSPQQVSAQSWIEHSRVHETTLHSQPGKTL